jgi:hypothetical protein
MPEPPNLWYEQPAYHKILPLVCDLSMKIAHELLDWTTACSGQRLRRMCDNFLGTTKICRNAKFSVQS